MSDPPSRLAAFLAELRHRRVFRVAIVYAGVAFIIFQIVDATFDVMGIPDWLGRFLIVVLLLGFLVAVGMAWAFDLTAEGLVRAKVKREPTAAKAPHHVIIGNKTLAAIAVLAIIVAAWSLLREPSPGGALISSIAVLPLDDLMGDPEQEYFVEGMHEAIISNLSRISALTVISRTSAMLYKDSDQRVPEIARELGVDAIVEGSVLKAGNRVRITAQLIHGASDEHLWVNDYEGDLTDILSLQKTVARAIAKEIGLALKPEEEAYLASAPQVNPEAYQLYLKGWHFRTMQSEESMPKAVEYLEQAVALDSTFALAWAALGHSYLQMQWQGDWSADSAFNRMKPVLDKALELDANLPDAHAGLGIYQELAQYDFTGAEASFRRALELDPDNNYAVYEYGMFLWRTGRPDEALEKFRRGVELDPLNPLPRAGFAWVYTANRQYDKALEYWQANLELSPGRAGTLRNIAGIEREILMQQGRYAEAVTEAEKAGDLFMQLRAEWALGNKEKVYAVRDSLRSTGELQQREQEDPIWAARFYAIMGEREKALSLLEKSQDPYGAALYYASLGEREKALSLLEKYYEDFPKEQLPSVDELYQFFYLVYRADFDSLRAEPRFKALLQKIGLTEVFDQYGQRVR